MIGVSGIQKKMHSILACDGNNMLESHYYEVDRGMNPPAYYQRTGCKQARRGPEQEVILCYRSALSFIQTKGKLMNGQPY